MKYINALWQKKARNQFDAFVIEGRKLIEEALKSNVSFEFVVYHSKFSDKHGALLEQLAGQGVELLWASEQEFEKFTHFNTSDGVLAVVKKIEPEVIEKNDTVLVFEGLNDPGNLGTIIRTADWFGIRHIVLGKNSVEVYNEKVVRATMGSLFRVSVHTQIDLEEFVDHYRERHEVIGTSLAGVSLTEHEKGAQGQPRIIIFGNESHGLSPKLAEKCDALVKIEGSGVAESLNLAISAAIIMYSLDRDAQ